MLGPLALKNTNFKNFSKNLQNEKLKKNKVGDSIGIVGSNDTKNKKND